MTKREELVCLLKMYKEGRYDISDFCDELTRILYYESGGINELDSCEQKYFNALGCVAERHSPYEEDHKLYPKVYRTDNEVKEAIERVYAKLIAKGAV